MADIADYTETFYSTPLLVRRRLRRAYSTTVLDDWEVVEAILRADNEINSSLTPFPYAIADFTIDTPWVSPILTQFRTEGTGFEDTPQPNNPASGRLRAVQVQTTAITDDYTIEFSSTTAYTITALLAGAEGTGSTASDKTVTSGRVIIPSSYWTGTFKAKDKFYFSTFSIDRVIVDISATLAAGLLAQDLYSPDLSSSPKIAEILLKRSRDLISRLAKPDDADGARLTNISTRNLAPIEHHYHISPDGEDITDYEPYENTPDKMYNI